MSVDNSSEIVVADIPKNETTATEFDDDSQPLNASPKFRLSVCDFEDDDEEDDGDGVY